MAKKKTKDNLTDLGQDWMGRGDKGWTPTSDGRAFDGQDVQYFIKEGLRNYSAFYAGYMYYFATRAKYDRWSSLDPDDEEQLKIKTDESNPEELWTWRTTFDFKGTLDSIVFQDSSDWFRIVTSNSVTAGTAAETSSCQLSSTTRYIYLYIPTIVTRQTSVVNSSYKDSIGDEYKVSIRAAKGTGGYNEVANFSITGGNSPLVRSISVGTAGSIKDAADYRFSMVVECEEKGLRSTAFIATQTNGSNTPQIVKVVDAAFAMTNTYWYKPLMGDSTKTTDNWTLRLSFSGKTAQTVYYRWYKERNADGSAGSGWEGSWAVWMSGKSNVPSYTSYPIEASFLPKGASGIYLLYIKTSVVINSETGAEMEIYKQNCVRVMYVKSGEETTVRLLTYSTLKTKDFANGTKLPMATVSVYNQGKPTPADVSLVLKSHITASGASSSSAVTYHHRTDVKPATATTINYTPQYESSLPEWLFGYGFQVEYGSADGHQFSWTPYADTRFTMTNPVAYNATAGASLIISPGNESNSNSKTQINNLAVANGKVNIISSDGVNFTDNEDGWTTDGFLELGEDSQETDPDTGEVIISGKYSRDCLKIQALSKFIIGYKPLSASLVSNSQSGFTLDLTFRTSNVADYDDDVFTIMSGTEESWQGIRIKGDRIIVHTQGADASKGDRDQDYTFMEDETINLIISFVRNYSKTGTNTCIIYANGAKVREFDFKGATTSLSSIINEGYITIGSKSCDFYLYGLRVYHKALSTIEAMNNYVASLPEYNKKEEAHDKLYSVIDTNSTADLAISLDKCKATGNVFVITPSMPVNGNDVKMKDCKVDYFYQNGPTIKWTGVTISGQGSSSKNYWRWNYKFDLGKTATPTLWSPDGSSKIRVATAKKNFASGTQSHKMGFTALYDTLHKKIVGPSNRNTAVFQYPFYGFLYDGTKYTFIGLYTLGPDKGDLVWFDYDNKPYMQVEGTDQSYIGTAFRCPMSAMEDDGENYNFNGTSNWEYTTSDESLKQKWEDAYELVHDTGQMVTTFSKSSTKDPNKDDKGYGSNEFINDLAQQTDKDKVNRKLGSYEIIQRNTGQANFGHVYYYDEDKAQWVKALQRDGTPLNVSAQLAEAGLSDAFANASTNVTSIRKETKLEVIKRARRILFKRKYADLWNPTGMMFEYTFKIINAISDNFKKNFYPFLFKNEKVDMRQDDLDTLGPINNNGKNGKKYYVEFEDTYTESEGAIDAVFSGTDSNLAQMLSAGTESESSASSFYSERIAMGQRILEEMHKMISPDTSTVSPYKAIMQVYQQFLWDKAQEKFPASAYNADTEYSYEDAVRQPAGAFKSDVDPFTQVTGPSYETERAWFSKRMIYCMSKYGYGDFTCRTTALEFGSLLFRPIQPCNMKIKYAMAIYPKCMRGQGDGPIPLEHRRVSAGEEFDMYIPVAETTYAYILAGDYIQSIETYNLTNDAAITLNSKRLTSVKIGGSSTFDSLNCSGCAALQSVDISGVYPVTGITLTGCYRLNDVNVSGTQISMVTIPDGSKIKKIHLSNRTSNIEYNNLRNVEEFIVDGYTNLRTLRLNGCTGINGVALLKECDNNSGLTCGLHNISDKYSGEEAQQIATFLTGYSRKANITYYKADGSITSGYDFISGTIKLEGVSSSVIGQINSGVFKDHLIASN